MAVEHVRFFKCSLGVPGMADDRTHVLFEVTQDGSASPNFTLGITYDEAEEFHRTLGLILAKRRGDAGFAKMTDIVAVRANPDVEPDQLVLGLLGQSGGEFLFRLPTALSAELRAQIQSAELSSIAHSERPAN